MKNKFIPVRDSAGIPGCMTPNVKNAARMQCGIGEMDIYEGMDVMILSVALISFTGKLQNNRAYLQWKTGTKPGISYFEIEKSINGQIYHTEGSVFANNSGNYNFSITQPEPRAYYRLRIVCSNGHSVFSNIVPLLQPFITGSLRVYPVPARDHISVWINKEGTIKICGDTGRVVQTQRAVKGMNTIDIHSLYKGIYFCEVNDNRARFIKE